MIRCATINDWPKLSSFYHKAYRKGHPLQNFEFWQWQYGNPEIACAYIVELDDEIKGHLGVIFSDNLSWVINLYVDEAIRATRWLPRLYDAVRDNGFIIITTNANDAALSMYRKLKWIRYANLERLIKINPQLQTQSAQEIIQPVSIGNINAPVNERYFLQPGIKGVLLSDGSTAVSQEAFGGLRFVEIKNPSAAMEEAWHLGYSWCDYLTSWNDTMIDKLLKNNWQTENEKPLPWKLSPVDFNSKSNITFLSENPVDKNLIVTRKHSDHGRVPSL